MRQLVTLLLFAATAAAAQVPARFHAQGVLRNAAGVIPDGSFDVVFRLYLAADATNAVWSQTKSPLMVQDGTFSESLGDGVTPLDAAWFTGQLYLGVQFGTDPELPRVRLDAVPYALSAATATGLSCTACVSESELDVAIATQAELDAAVAELETALDGSNVTLEGAVADLAVALADAKTALEAAITAHAASGDHDSRYLRLTGGTLSGLLTAGAGLELAGAQLTRFRVHNAPSAPYVCDSNALGALYFDVTDDGLKVCTSKGWNLASFQAPLGSAPTVPAASCKAIVNVGASKGSGIYWLIVGGQTRKLYCDMVTDGGGWTLVRVANGTTGVSLLTEAAVNPAALTSPTVDANAQLSSSEADALGNVMMAVNTASPFHTVWYDKSRACSSALRFVFWTYRADLPHDSSCPSASSVAPPSENRWGLDVGGGGTHINWLPDHPLCFGSWASPSKGHICTNRNSWDWWNYGTDAAGSGNPTAKTAIYMR